MKYFLNPSYGIDFTKCFPIGHRNCGNYEKIYLTNNLIGDLIKVPSMLKNSFIYKLVLLSVMANLRIYIFAQLFYFPPYLRPNVQCSGFKTT